MQVSDFDYPLPDEHIARHPCANRTDSRLLVLDAGSATLEDRHFRDLVELLNPGDLLVFNDTRVLAARLNARKQTGGRSEILVERILDGNRASAHVRASKSPKPGSRLIIDADVYAEVEGREVDLFLLRFSEPVAGILSRYGETPLPPYLQRPVEIDDIERYQTVYARVPGAVAAPTAGLHFDAALLEATRTRGVEHCFVTLHVGAGTFQNLRQDDIQRQRLHAERLEVSADVCAAVTATRQRGGRVVAVGTTTVRALETASSGGQLAPFAGETEIFIVPGYSFRSVDALITNFHLPKSSLLMLVAAFAGTERVLAAYRHAVAERYRFFSYGDAMFLSPGSCSPERSSEI